MSVDPAINKLREENEYLRDELQRVLLVGDVMAARLHGAASCGVGGQIGSRQLEKDAGDWDAATHGLKRFFDAT